MFYQNFSLILLKEGVAEICKFGEFGKEMQQKNNVPSFPLTSHTWT